MRAPLLCLLLALPVAAQDRPYEFPVYEVTASRLPAAAARTPGNTTVLDRDDIERLQPSSTAELLASVPGLHLTTSGGLSTLHLRGADPNFTLILVDGVQVNDPTDARGGAFDLDAIDPSEIERVEIVRGPASAVHGSDALAGVVQIVTRSAAGGFLQVEGGDDSLLRLAGGVTEARGGLKFRHLQEDDGETQRRRDSQMLGAQAELRDWRLDARAEQSESDHFPESSGGPRLAEVRDREHEEVRSAQLSVQGAHAIESFGRLRTRLDLLQSERDVETPAIAPSSPFGIPALDSSDQFRRLRANLDVVRTVRRIEAGIGAEFRLEEAESEGSIQFVGPTDYSRIRRIGSLFSELRFLNEFLTAEGALRFDANEGEFPHWSPRVALQWKPNRRGTRLKAGYAHGFKLPSFYALGHPIVGDPELRPERSNNFDVAVVQALAILRGHVEVGWFHGEYEDLIDLEFGMSGPKLVNRNQVTSQGIEAALLMRPHERVELRAELSQAKTEIEESGDPLRDRPEWKASVEVQWRPRADLSLNLRALHVGEVPSESVATGAVELDAFQRLDLSARWQLRPQLAIHAAVDNLTDAEYEQAIGFPAPGIGARLGIRTNF